MEKKEEKKKKAIEIIYFCKREHNYFHVMVMGFSMTKYCLMDAIFIMNDSHAFWDHTV